MLMRNRVVHSSVLRWFVGSRTKIHNGLQHNMCYGPLWLPSELSFMVGLVKSDCLLQGWCARKTNMVAKKCTRRQLQLSEVIKSTYMYCFLNIFLSLRIHKIFVTYWYVLYLDNPMPTTFLLTLSTPRPMARVPASSLPATPNRLGASRCFGAGTTSRIVHRISTSHCTDVFPSHWKKTTQHRMRSLAYSM